MKLKYLLQMMNEADEVISDTDEKQPELKTTPKKIDPTVQRRKDFQKKSENGIRKEDSLTITSMLSALLPLRDSPDNNIKEVRVSPSKKSILITFDFNENNKNITMKLDSPENMSSSNAAEIIGNEIKAALGTVIEGSKIDIKISFTDTGLMQIIPTSKIQLLDIVKKD